MSNEKSWHGWYLFDEGARDSLYEHCHELREMAPVNETPVGLWRLTRHRDCMRLLREAKAGMRSTDGDSYSPRMTEQARHGRAQFMLFQDPPRTRACRKLVSHAFTPRAIERWRAEAERIADACLDAVADRREIDVIADLALPVPSTVICEMLGVPLADREKFTTWTAEATHAITPESVPGPCSDGASRESGDVARRLLRESHRQAARPSGRGSHEPAHPRRGRRRPALAGRAHRAIDRSLDRRLRDHHRPDRQRRARAACFTPPSSRSCARDPSSSRPRSRSAYVGTGPSRPRCGFSTRTRSTASRSGEHAGGRGSGRRESRSGGLCGPRSIRHRALAERAPRLSAAAPTSASALISRGSRARSRSARWCRRFPRLELVSENVEWGRSLFRVPATLRLRKKGSGPFSSRKRGLTPFSGYGMRSG